MLRPSYRSRLDIMMFGAGRTPHLSSNLFGSSNLGTSSYRSLIHENNNRIFYNIYGPGSHSNATTNTNERPHEPKPIIPTAVTSDESILRVLAVDLKVIDNAKAHHTGEYDICKSRANPKLVIRRGQPFNVAITFSKKYDESVDDLRLVFEYGDSPMPSKGTSVEFILSHEDKKNEWGACIVSNADKTVTLTVFTPPTTYVGQWNLKIDVVKKENSVVNIHRYMHKDPVYIIFNPWCKDDEVYMESEKEIGEYVLNQSGGIFVGSQGSITYRPWNFAQFESCVLDTALYLLDNSDLTWTARGNPILVVRKISALVNSNDDNGLLSGNWSGNYPGGHAPTEWTGSGRIIEKYWKSKSPVKYGQCWVFSGLSTTICRTLGIPARSVTNFESAHDSDGSISIDYYNIESSWKNTDSIWNFHVWNEAWMARPDLPQGYGGWQVFDATPQETSEGVYCCGPTSVRAVRDGNVNLPYDGPFVFSEVNADKAYWIMDQDSRWQCVDLQTDSIGKYITTKAIGSNAREDLTDQYKPKEGSAAERVMVSCAYINANRPDISGLNKNKAQDVQFTLTEDKENNLGGNFELLLTMKNTSKEVRTVEGCFEVCTMYYTGVLADQVKKDDFTQLIIKPLEEKTYKISLTPQEYVDKLKDFGMFDVSMWAMVKETQQNFIKKGDYRLHRPHLKVNAVSESKLGEEIKVDVSFINPLKKTLTNCFVLVDGVGSSKKFQQGNVEPGATFYATLPIKLTKEGQLTLIVNFNSDQLQDVNASYNITSQKTSQ